MYNKLFTKILDSSIWLEEDHVRLVWITFLAVMDQDGVVALSGIGNVAVRARVTPEKAAEAIQCLESPDDKNPDQDQEGRRIERIPGVGWFVLNAEKYRDIIKAETIRAQNRERVRRYRSERNADVTVGNDSVTLSDTNTDTKTEEIREETPQAAPSRKKGTRCPEPFLLTQDMREYGATKRPDIDLVLETEKFVNYWRAKAGKDGSKLDWLATWRNWILNARGNGNGAIGGNNTSTRRTPGEIIANREYR